MNANTPTLFAEDPLPDAVPVEALAEPPSLEPSSFEPSSASSEEALETVRPDRNLEKWPIWEPSNSRQAPRARTIQREVRLPDGSKVIAKVEVGYSDKGLLTTEDQKTLYALVRHWEERQRPTGTVVFSKQQLSRILRKSWGQKVNAALTASLLRLRFTPFTWERSYYDNATRETVGRIDTFTILSELFLTYRQGGQTTSREACTFQFNARILNNLLTGYTRPVFLDTVLSFKSEIAQILYTHLDLVLSDKNHYERRTKELFDDLGIDGATYRYPSKRAQVLEPALRELEGQPLPTGALREARLEKTVDGLDFKIVVRKARGRPTGTKSAKEVGRASAVTQGPKNAMAGQGADAAEAAPDPKTSALNASAMGEAAESEAGALEAARAQVRHFYQVFFRTGETAQPTPKELAQAQEHASRLGEERARYLVTFAFRAARATQFDIQTYGGLLQYEGRAVAEFEENARLRAEAIFKKAQQSHRERFSEGYTDYLRAALAAREAAPSARFAAFLVSEDEFRAKYARGPLAGHSSSLRVLRDYEVEEARLERLAEFFAPGPTDFSEAETVLDFWRWDAALNPTPFSPPKLAVDSHYRTSDNPSSGVAANAKMSNSKMPNPKTPTQTQKQHKTQKQRRG